MNSKNFKMLALVNLLFVFLVLGCNFFQEKVNQVTQVSAKEVPIKSVCSQENIGQVVSVVGQIPIYSAIPTVMLDEKSQTGSVPIPFTVSEKLATANEIINGVQYPQARIVVPAGKGANQIFSERAEVQKGTPSRKITIYLNSGEAVTQAGNLRFSGTVKATPNDDFKCGLTNVTITRP